MLLSIREEKAERKTTHEDSHQADGQGDTGSYALTAKDVSREQKEKP